MASPSERRAKQVKRLEAKKPAIEKKEILEKAPKKPTPRAKKFPRKKSN
tara:strand:+ start:807 stop:953 length:147 start_codon:yes stop_codon:yes gene_type:complete